MSDFRRIPASRQSPYYKQAEQYAKQNLAIAKEVLAKPDAHIPGVVYWAELVLARYAPADEFRLEAPQCR